MMHTLILIARNVFRGILYRRILYLWVAAIGLLILRAAPAIFLNLGNEALQNMMRQRAASDALGTWSTLCIALAIFMGASAIGSEIHGKTIVTVLARPVRRWEFMVGKWIGVQSFALLSLLLGLLASLAVARYLEADLDSKVLGLSLAQTAAAISLYSALAIGLSALAASGVAGALTVIVAFLPAFVTFLVASENAVNHGIGVVLDYGVPPGYTSHYDETIDATVPLNAVTFGGRGRGGRRGEVPPFFAQPAPPAEIDYNSEFKAIGQNIGYGLVFLALGCAIFSRRDVRLG
jgi:ABC-type transport system involved in multi-copper enzyme maturation permease subunit